MTMTVRTSVRFVFCALLVSALLAGVGSAAWAQAPYPAKPVTLLVPFGPGGSTDLAARALAQGIPQYLGQPVVVVNKPGASGAVAMKALIESPSDGYTLMMAAIGTNAIMPAVTLNLPFKHDQITPMARTQVNPTVLAVRPDSPWKSLQDFLEAVKKNPGGMRASTAGVGTLHDLGMQILVRALGLPKRSVTTIPYKSGAEATTALVGGHVDATYTNLIEVLSQLKAGTGKPLAVVSPVPGKRVRDLPEVPTFAEMGFPQMDILGWRGVVGPPGLAASIVEKWETAVKKMTEDRRWRETIEKLGDEVGFLDAKGFGEFIEKEYRRYHAIATELGIVVGR